MQSTLVLLEKGADGMLKDKQGHTAVEVAIAKQFSEIVEVLVARIGSVMYWILSSFFLAAPDPFHVCIHF
jgi:hypothetical protein